MKQSDPRRIQDVETLSALSHTVRSRIVDLLDVDGPSTVGRIARELGEAVGNVSHHVKVLADVGLVEEVPELARDRRERWWRRTSAQIGWTTRDFEGDPTGELVEAAAASANLDRQVRHVRAWLDAPKRVRTGWADGPFATSWWVTADDAELAELGEELRAVLRRWAERDIPDDGRDRDTVFVFAHGIPARP